VRASPYADIDVFGMVVAVAVGPAVAVAGCVEVVGVPVGDADVGKSSAILLPQPARIAAHAEPPAIDNNWRRLNCPCFRTQLPLLAVMPG